MKKLLPILLVFIITSCVKDELLLPVNEGVIPKALEISSLQGIKVESIFVEDEVRINTKLQTAGEYRIKIKDITGTLVSQDIVKAEEGDNIFNIYVNTLPESSYTILLTDINHNIIGVETIVVN